MSAPLQPEDPWNRRLYGWLDERFPPVVYTVLVLLFHGSAVLVAGTFGGSGRLAPAAVIVTWLFFLHLRIFDEHKDFDADCEAYPDRLLSRGVVTLPLLRRLAAVAIGLEAVLAATLGGVAFVAWLGALAFSVAMAFEFGFGRWLKDHIVLYAITHNPVVAALALFLHAASDAPWSNGYWWYVALASLGSLGFELGRKIRLPQEEHEGVPSYTTELGQDGARWLLLGIHCATWASASGLYYALGLSDPWPVVLGVAAAGPGIATSLGAQPAKRVELGASVVLLVSFLACGSVALGMR